ncbi:MarR family winged helix-turn-helix transcriptional regulator [Modestobacter sp. SSW1-42]|uniref:MarR family winged helix-turn-helix transcriptional regulator n=1 Tax=Modestobacter sp. SSW1-42 TaxID=596372 RepID=UPI003987099D
MSETAVSENASPSDPLSLPEELVHLVRVMHLLKNQSTGGAGPEARERAAHVLLFPLTRLGPLRQGALAELVHADPSTVSRHVTLLVERGLVRRVADASDGRASRLVVTPAGEAVLDQMRQERAALFAQVTADWDAGELHTFTRQLHRLVRQLSDHLPTLGTAPGGATTTPEKDR